ncbi:hypothetical protein EXIGLDRAFT_729486 [Exidia glandulosa HHB12029]|uniref:Uncharacterized protein n=1 Tax=Exidia glandulosa HHB12029 TaxID=1314781 RepID=A0A165CJM4_EXIGL|nr:hypothetical protein EXIGLDRAFT_729486 [Exidia glandulosa HHB12029]
MSGTPLLPLELYPGALVLVTDHLQAPSDFLLLRILAQRLKHAEASRSSVVVSFNHDTVRWQSLALKSGVNLKQHVDNGSLTLVDASQEDSDISAAALWTRIHPHIAADAAGPSHSKSKPGLVILDGLNVLEWIGVPQQDVARLLRAVYAHCSSAGIALVVRYHAVGQPSERDANLDNPLLRLLLQLCTFHLEALPLVSGRSGAVSGEVALHPGLLAPKSAAVVPRNKAVQYRLTDSGAVFFERGNAGNVL